MTRPVPYFMHDQVRHRVRVIMGGRQRAAAFTDPLWPLIAAVCALTFLNLMTAMPTLGRHPSPSPGASRASMTIC